MDTTHKSLLWSLVALSLVTIALGAYGLRAEARTTALGAGASPLAAIIAMASEDVTVPYSVQGRRVLLEGCELLLQPKAPLQLRLASEQQQSMIMPFCKRFAQASVDAAPTDAYAWLVLAMAQAREGDLQSAGASIVWSQLTGATESWIAQDRFGLAQDHYDQLPADAQAAGDADTVLLLSTRRAVVVARRYMQDPDFRARAEALIARQPQSVQRSFISLLRRQV
jgi:hypothetical protein